MSTTNTGFRPDDYLLHSRISELEQEVLELKERVKVNDNFLNIAAHEVKTPVTVLKAYSQMLLMQFAKDGQQKYVPTVEKMSGQLDKIVHMIADLLDTARFSSDSLYCLMNDVDLNQSVSSCFENVKAAHPSYNVSCQLTPGNPIVSGDRERLEQVIDNFINNAIKYSPSNKIINIKSEVLNDEFKVTVTDNGNGIPTEKQSHIFEQFYRVDDDSVQKLPGLGLGLFICSEIIKKHHGNIGVNSEVGKGSSFWFSLPVKPNRNL
ncbi:MAG: HAMP domain-containing sensor histidine kinase [Bacteroidota bacterium]